MKFCDFSRRLFMGDCGHIKVQWDNRHNCLKCSSCSRLSTCSTCSTWSEETWILADKRRTYIARKSVMTRKRQNKKKRLAVTSDLSDDNTIDGSTTPQGYTARDRTHQGGLYSDAECIQSESPRVTSQPGALVNQSTSDWSASHWSTRHRAVFSLVNKAPGNHSLFNPSPVIRSFSDYQALGTGYLIPSHWSTSNRSPGTSEFTRHWSSHISRLIMISR